MGFSCLWLLAAAPSRPDAVATGLVLAGSGEKAFLSQPQVAAEASVRPSLYRGIVMQNPGPNPIPGGQQEVRLEAGGQEQVVSQQDTSPRPLQVLLCPPGALGTRLNLKKQPGEAGRQSSLLSYPHE